MNKANNEIKVQILSEIEKRDGSIQPEVLVAEASSSLHPLHNEFTWDDGVASDNWRIHEARQIINSVRVVIDHRKVQAFQNCTVRIDDRPVRGYYSTYRILSDKDMLAQILTRALNELELWQGKYDTYNELSGIINTDLVAKVKETI
jgi:hypothetical protein